MHVDRRAETADMLHGPDDPCTSPVFPPKLSLVEVYLNISFGSNLN